MFSNSRPCSGTDKRANDLGESTSSMRFEPTCAGADRKVRPRPVLAMAACRCTWRVAGIDLRCGKLGAGSAGALHDDFGEIAGRPLPQAQEAATRHRAAVLMREPHPGELVQVAVTASGYKANGHALGALGARAGMDVPCRSCSSRVPRPGQRSAIGVLADKPLRKFQHVDADEARSLPIILPGRLAEGVVEG
jgi:hypothetical protein